MTSAYHNPELHSLISDLTLLLRPYFAEHVNKNSNRTIPFNDLWQYQINDAAIVDKAFRTRNQFQHTGYELIFFCYVNLLIRNRILFSPSIRVWTDVNDGPEQIFIGTHTGLAPMSGYAMTRGWTTTYMSSWPMEVKLSQLRTGIRSCENNFFPVDSNSLLKTRKLINEGKVLLLTADFRDEKGFYSCISPSIFKLAAKECYSIYYHVSTINANGEIVLAIEGPFSGDANTLLSKFVEFQMRVRPHVTYRASDYKYTKSLAYSLAQHNLRSTNPDS